MNPLSKTNQFFFFFLEIARVVNNINAYIRLQRYKVSLTQDDDTDDHPYLLAVETGIIFGFISPAKGTSSSLFSTQKYVAKVPARYFSEIYWRNETLLLSNMFCLVWPQETQPYDIFFFCISLIFKGLACLISVLWWLPSCDCRTNMDRCHRDLAMDKDNDKLYYVSWLKSAAC